MADMDLKTYVKETLCQIVGGVADAQAAVKMTNAAIHPVESFRSQITPTAIAFEVAISVSEIDGSKVGGEAGVNLLKGFVAKVDSEISNANQSQQTGRIKFSVPILLPFVEKNTSVGQPENIETAN